MAEAAPLVSVILPLGNGLPIVGKLLDQLENQTCIDVLELVVIDFGSSDGSLDRVKAYAAKHPLTTVVKTPKGRGITSWFNEGIRHARGEFILLTAEDCYPLAMDAVARAVQRVREDPNPLTWAGPTVLHPRELWEGYDFWNKLWFSREAGRICRGCVAAKFDVFRKEGFERLGHLDDEAFRFCGDADFYLRLQAAGGHLVASDVEIIHAHGVGKRDGLKDYLLREMLYGEMAGALRRHYPLDRSGRWYGVMTKPLLCIGSLIPHVWWFSWPLLLLYAICYRPGAYTIPDLRTFLTPLFNLAGLYAFTMGYARGLFTGKQSLAVK